MRHFPIPFVLLSLALFGAGCRVPTPEELAEQTAADVETFWKEAVATARITNTMKVRDELFSNVEGLQRNPSFSRPTVPDATSTTDAFADVKVYLKRIFAEENVLERSPGGMVFRVSGTALCTPARGGIADSRCVADVEKLNLTVRASGGGGGANLTLLLDRRLELFTLSIVSGKSIGVTVDLASAQKGVEFINATFGVDSPFRNSTIAGEGKLEVVLSKRGDDDFALTVAALSALSGTMTDDHGFTRSASTAARNPLLEARIDGPQKTVHVTVDVGPSELRGKWSDFFDYDDNTPMTWSLAGATSRVSLSDDGPRTVTGISAGGGVSRLMYGGQTLAAFNLKEKVDLELGSGTSGLASFTVRPGASADVMLDFRPLPGSATRFDPALLDRIYSYELTSGDGAPAAELLRASATPAGAWLKLTRGRLSLAGPDAASTRAFSAVSCLNWRTGSLTASQNPMLDVFQLEGCP